jgi:transposase
MGNYLKMASQQHISALLELGWSHRRIAREVGVHRETVSRYAALTQAKPANPIAGAELQTRPNPIPGPLSAAAPYHEVIEKGLERGLTAQRIWQDLREEHGYGHGYLTVQRYARRVKRRRPEVADVMEHPPGEEAQVDYFKSPAPVLNPTTGRWGRPWVFRMTLSCSKHGYEEALWGQDRTGFLRAHEHAFAALNGVPRVIRHDNLKAAVVRACLYDPDVSDVYEAFGKHWGFVALPGRPYHPEEQGVAENSGGYVKRNALKGRRFDSVEQMNEFLRRWNRTIAQQRIHGTTRKQVLAHFLEVEQPALQALPAASFELFESGTRIVHLDGFVEVDAGYYTAPHHLLGRAVRVRWDERLVRIYHEGRMVRLHVKQHRSGSWSTNPEDRPAHKPARQAAYQELLLNKARHIGPRALAWAEAAIEERDVRAYRLLQGVIGLTRSHPKERVDWGCGVALDSRAFRYRTVRRLVEQAAERTKPTQPVLTHEHELIRPLEQYALFAAGGV